MPEPPASTLTPREQAVADFFRRPRVADACMVTLAAVLGLIARGLVQGICHPVPTPPDPTSTGGKYCATVSHGWSWIAYAAAAVLIACGVRSIARGPNRRRIALIVVFVLGVVATVWVSSLPNGIGLV